MQNNWMENIDILADILKSDKLTKEEKQNLLEKAIKAEASHIVLQGKIGNLDFTEIHASVEATLEQAKSKVKEAEKLYLEQAAKQAVIRDYSLDSYLLKMKNKVEGI